MVSVRRTYTAAQNMNPCVYASPNHNILDLTNFKAFADDKINPFSHNKIFIKTKLKPFAEDKLNVTKLIISVCDKVENIVGKGEIACTSNFSFSHNVFKRLLS